MQQQHKEKHPSEKQKQRDSIDQNYSDKKLKIKSKKDQLNWLILEKGYTKVRVISNIAVASKNGHQIKSKIMIVPSSYSLFKLKQQIKKSFNIQKEAIFVFAKGKNIADSNLTVKEMFQKFTLSGNFIVQCLELNIYSTQFS